jgi:uncharacterized protein (TIGR00369 family)
VSTIPVTENHLASQGWKARTLPGHIGLVGPLWTRWESEAWAYGLLAGTQHLNPAGVVHGGAIATLIDHTLSTIGWEATGRKPCITVQMNVNFLEPALQGHFLVARGRVVRGGSSLLFVSGAVQAGDIEIAHASAVLKVLRTSPLQGLPESGARPSSA